jgi:hypothetical protein
MSCELNLNKLINEYVKPKNPIYKIHYFQVSVAQRDDDEDYITPEDFYVSTRDKITIVEAITPQEPIKYVKNSPTSFYKYTNVELIDKHPHYPLDIINEIYDPTSFNGLKQIKPVLLLCNDLDLDIHIYRIEKLA